MGQRDQIEAEIRHALALEESAISLSNRLFDVEGLFGRLATTEEERREVAASPLFKEAQHRLTELMKREAEEFRQAIRSAETAFPKGRHLLKVERTEAV
jgi:hypothetical protein